MAESRSEFEYIDWIRSHVASRPNVPLGIGDDAAVVRIPPPGDCLVTVDMLMEGVDFQSETPPRDVGRKALAVSLSDIAAMAGRPLAAFVSVALSQRCGVAFAKELHSGIQELADEFDVVIAGGDTNAWDGRLVISVTVLGQPTGTGPVPRSGAQPGDWIFVTGEFGGSIGGKHLTFRPRVHEAVALHRLVTLHAMIDVSDGLAADLHHVLEESTVGAVVHSDAIPVSEAAQRLEGEKSAINRALGDGEDFELLFTVAPDDGKRLLADASIGVPLSRIGEITADRKCEIVAADGSRAPLPPAGWVHDLGRDGP